jgi:hypothetical protein
MSGTSITDIETYGVERIPDADRTARPFDLFRVAFGGANTFATCVLGVFPVLFGLSFWHGVAATVLGLVVGSLILAPLSLFGPRNGTNNAVSSSAHLGVHGRVIGSGGVDVSLPVGLAAAGLLFLVLLVLYPEPRGVYGPEGPRLVRASDAPVLPIVEPAARVGQRVPQE